MDKKIPLILKYLTAEYESSFFERSSDPFYILISTVLSQRTRDENTDRVARDLFKVYGSPKKLAQAPLKEVEKLIKASGFYRVKAKRIKKIAGHIVKIGHVPDDREKLMELEGVGPKTAGCVLVYAFRKPAIPVDTHVHRISNRIGIIKTKTPEKSEYALMKVIPKSKWIEINEFMVKFGQNKCFPRRPMCSKCKLTRICKFYKENRGTKMIR